MCRRITCKTCGKATYSGCGQHVDEVLAGVPASARCTGHERTRWFLQPTAPTLTTAGREQPRTARVEHGIAAHGTGQGSEAALSSMKSAGAIVLNTEASNAGSCRGDHHRAFGCA